MDLMPFLKKVKKGKEKSCSSCKKPMSKCKCEDEDHEKGEKC